MVWLRVGFRFDLSFPSIVDTFPAFLVCNQQVYTVRSHLRVAAWAVLRGQSSLPVDHRIYLQYVKWSHVKNSRFDEHLTLLCSGQRYNLSVHTRRHLFDTCKRQWHTGTLHIDWLSTQQVIRSNQLMICVKSILGDRITSIHITLAGGKKQGKQTPPYNLTGQR